MCCDADDSDLFLNSLDKGQFGGSRNIGNMAVRGTYVGSEAPTSTWQTDSNMHTQYTNASRQQISPAGRQQTNTNEVRRRQRAIGCEKVLRTCVQHAGRRQQQITHKHTNQHTEKHRDTQEHESKHTKRQSKHLRQSIAKRTNKSKAQQSEAEQSTATASEQQQSKQTNRGRRPSAQNKNAGQRQRLHRDLVGAGSGDEKRLVI